MRETLIVIFDRTCYSSLADRVTTASGPVPERVLGILCSQLANISKAAFIEADRSSPHYWLQVKLGACILMS
jgi:hypothetical protein